MVGAGHLPVVELGGDDLPAIAISGEQMPGGGHPDDFAIVDNTCSGQQLAPGEGCLVTVQLTVGGEFLRQAELVIDVAGQRVSARDRLYLANEIPTLIVWGERDAVIPASHGHIAHELMPGSRLEIVPGAGHFLPFERPELLDRLLRDFLATTSPANVSPERWHDVLTHGA